MTKYNKLIGAIVGAVLTLLVIWGIIPSDMATPENINTIVVGIGGIVGVGAAIATYFAPKNTN